MSRRTSRCEIGFDVIPSVGAKRRSRGIASMLVEGTGPSFGKMAIPRLRAFGASLGMIHYFNNANAASIIAFCASRVPCVLRCFVVLNATSTAVCFAGSKYMNARNPA